MNKKTAPVFFIFLVMGFGDLIGPLVSLVRQKLILSQFEASLIAFAGFIMFGSLSIPAGFFQNKYGKRTTVVVGLLLVLSGLITPLTGLNSFNLFILAVSLLGAGSTVLQVSGSPLLHDLSEPGAYARNLTFGQFIKGIGTLSSPLIPLVAIKYFDNRWEIVFVIFACMTVLAIAFFLLSTNKQTEMHRARTPASFFSIFAELAEARSAILVLAIFLYVGAEVCLSANLPALLQLSGYQPGEAGMAGIGIFFLSIMSGRFLGSIILKWISAKPFFLYSCLLSIIGIMLLTFVRGIGGFAGALITGFGFSNIFPLIFSIAIDQKPEKATELSALMVTAIAGGAIVPAIMGLVSDSFSLQTSVLIPGLCLAYLTILAIYQIKAATNEKR